MKPHEDESPEIDRLREELHQLERRVDAIEHSAGHLIEPAPITAGVPLSGLPDYGLPSAPNAIPVAGRAVLGLAGAFLLRAVAESGAVPSLLVVAVAILYAAAWLVFSVRSFDRDALAGTAYGITAALVLAPLLWEATVRFRVLPPLATAAILIAYLLLSSVLAWPKSSGAPTIVTILTTLVTAIALMIQTGDLIPFVVALLAVACIVEATACRGHARNMRPPVAIAVDFAIWLLFFVMTRPGGVPEAYKPAGTAICLTLGVLLFLIYGVSIVWQTAVIGHDITAFEIVQSLAAFALSAVGAMQLTHGRAALSTGALCAVACAGSYLCAFFRFADSSRNHHVFASWGAALGLAACILILPESQLTAIWSAAAALAMLAGARTSQKTPVIHSGLYLFAAGLTSGLPLAILSAFTGASLEPATPALWIFAASSACCYGVCFSARMPAKLSFVPALFTAVSFGALSILVVIRRVAGNPTASFLATARTLVTCGLALAFGFTGSRTGHRELALISYVAIALGTVKLILEDFRQSHPAALAVSLVCYGVLLIVVPKLNAKSFSRTI